MIDSTITIGRIFGIRLAVSPSWFAIFAVITYGLGALYFPGRFSGWPPAAYWASALLASLLFFVCVLLHELAHSLVALRFKIQVKSITLFVFGGVSQIAHDALTPGAELLIAIAGPAMSLLLGLLAAMGWWLLQGQTEIGAAACFWLAGVNVTLGVFNLLPGFPLDGGRLLRALIWFAAEDQHWATRVAARAGQVSSLCLVASGGYILVAERQHGLGNGLWLILIGGFLFQAAARIHGSTVLLQDLDGVTVGDVMRRDPPRLEADQSVAELADFLLANPRRAPLVVVRDGRAVGLVGTHALGQVGDERRSEILVGQVMLPLRPEQLLPEHAPAARGLELLVESGLGALPVYSEGGLTGLLRQDDLVRFIHVRRQLRG